MKAEVHVRGLVHSLRYKKDCGQTSICFSTGGGEEAVCNSLRAAQAKREAIRTAYANKKGDEADDLTA